MTETDSAPSPPSAQAAPSFPSRFDRAGQWVAMVANLGVFLGFLLVAYQIHVSMDSLKSASLQKASDLSSGAEVALMGDSGYDAVAKSMVDPAALSYGELMQVWTYLSISQFSAMQSFQDYDEGRTSEQDWLYSREVFISHFNYPMGRVWWEETKRYTGTSPELALVRGFFDSVEEGLQGRPENQVNAWFVEMHERAKALAPTKVPGT